MSITHRDHHPIAAIVSKSRVHDIVVNGTKGVGKPKACKILKLGGQLFPAKEYLFGGRTPFDQSQLIVDQGGTPTKADR